MAAEAWTYCPIRDQYLGHVISIVQSERSIQVMWQVLSNQRPVFKSCDKYCPIRDQYSSHVTSIVQSETSIQVKWSVLSNQREVFRSRDQYCPIRGQYSDHVTSIVQSQASIQIHVTCFHQLEAIIYLESLHGLLKPRLELLNLLGQVPHLGIKAVADLQYQPIRDQYWGHVMSIDQSEISIEVTWSVLTNHRPVFTLL